MIITFVTHSVEETQKIGELLGKELRHGTVIALKGDLGSGKTTFVQGFANGLGIQDRVISPTFVIMRKYAIEKRKELEHFYHIDFYRIHSSRDIVNLDFETVIHNPKNVVAIEWAERLPELLPKKKLYIAFEYVDESQRKITFTLL